MGGIGLLALTVNLTVAVLDQHSITFDLRQVEADYAKLDVYAIAKYPRRPTNA